MILASILAAGSSSRFGSQKLLSDYRGRKLLQWPIDALKKSDLEGTVVVSEGLDLSGIDTGRFTVVRNGRARLGLSESVKLAIEGAKGYDGILILLGDMPGIDEKLVERVLKMAGDRIVFPNHGGIKGFPVFLPSKFFKEAEDLEGDVGLRKLVKDHGEEIATFEGGKECVFDVDRPEDLANG